MHHGSHSRSRPQGTCGASGRENARVPHCPRPKPRGLGSPWASWAGRARRFPAFGTPWGSSCGTHGSPCSALPETTGTQTPIQ
eukprot:scaffold1311_cov256-Pinguiococcus_pyrenoidosus.AAC.49